MPVAGQQGWYIPSVPGSVDQFIFTYDGNALGLPANPFGEAQFFGAQTPDQPYPTLPMFPRGQLNFDWSAANTWTVSYDFTSAYNGTLPAVDNISSFSLQDSLVARYFIAVNAWADAATADQWNALYVVFDSTGIALDPNGVSPGPAWRNLEVGHWYNESTTFDFDSNTILSVTITDLETGDSTTFEPTDWFLASNNGSPLPLPTGLRFFVGGGGGPTDPQAGNVGAFDNLTITPSAAASAPNKSDPQAVQRAGGRPGAVTN